VRISISLSCASAPQRSPAIGGGCGGRQTAWWAALNGAAGIACPRVLALIPGAASEAMTVVVVVEGLSGER
jgi:hypothetical protein